MNMHADDTIQTIDRFVTHVSTVPANLGQTVGLHLREKVATAVAASVKPHVVLFVHGGFSPSNVAYDLDYKSDYSFMRVLARAGYDVFAMTHTAYGSSPKPMGRPRPYSTRASLKPRPKSSVRAAMWSRSSK